MSNTKTTHGAAAPAPPKRGNLLQTKGVGQGTPPARVHREPHSALVRVRDSDSDGK
jgi:hypothetical protein